MQRILRIGLLAGLPLLAVACSGSGAGPEMAGGSTLSAVRGDAGGSAPLRPEPGNIWAEGLQAEAPARMP
ncbi:hypothetical protein [Teichococcus aestuarii]|uniref:Uncharacterized protein n=2 Tax=Teichococcus aestuarii TaxID=568898 RepID=A0A2U1V690_9PROT|nr:hypothetical protein CR165_05470 [Pseudoroseomonas aestuarii]